MLWTGYLLQEVEFGSAWHVYPGPEKNGWLVGFSATSALRFMPKEAKASEIAIKWYEHDPAESERMGKNKPISQGRSISILVNEGGRFEVRFWKDNPDDPLVVLLTKSSDFVIWGPGVNHEWRCLAPATILTVRWLPEETPVKPM